MKPYKRRIAILLIILVIGYFTATTIMKAITPIIERQCRVKARSLATEFANEACINNMQNITYFDVKSCITIPPEKKLPIISCSYISNYNTIAELRSFIAFHRIQGVSKVVFYQSTVIEGFEKAFEKLINSGYLITIDFTWPRPEGICGLKQRTNQLAQINACYNRFRFYADALIMCDVDEYIYSMRFPYNLPDALHYLVETYRKNNVFIVFLTIIMLCSYIQIV